MRTWGTGVAALAAVVVAACGGGSDRPAGRAAAPAVTAAREAPRSPALCGALRARITGRVAGSAATELSGLVLSRSQRGVLWTHNDSGDSPRLLAIRADGRLLGQVGLTGAEHVDWEDVAARGRTLYVGDIGDNLAQRESIVVYRLAEPQTLGGAASTAAAQRIELRYPDGARDAEALLVDPSDGALVIVEKSFTGRAGVYVARPPAAAANAPATMRRAGRMVLGGGEAITAGDISADGRTIVLRSYGRAYVWTRLRGESVAAALRRRPCSPRADLFVEGQGEALAVSRDGRAFVTVAEGARPAIRRYAPT